MGVFIKHSSCNSCGSSDGRAVYEDSSTWCFVCETGTISEELKEEYKNKKNNRRNKKVRTERESMEETSKSTKPAITDEKNKEIKENTSISGKGYRGLKDEYSKLFGVRYGYDEKTGEVNEQYYPVTQEGQLTGYKVREIPKNFRSIGRTGADCELFGQFKFNRGGKYVLIVEGELDMLSAYQMLAEYNKQRGSDYETATVSPTTGANSQKQIAAQYKFFDTFDNIVLCYDQDKAGKEAAEKVIPYLPKGKVKVMQMRYKDPNEYLTQGKQKEFIQDFYNAKTYTPAGVVGSSELYEKLLESTQVKKIPLPQFLSKLDDMLNSVDLGTIGIIAAGSGAAKTTVANELIYFWLFNSPYKIGVVSLELTCGQYAQAMLSRHIENKIANIKDPGEKLKFLERETVKTKADELFKTLEGQDRFMVIDERDGSIEVLQDKIEEMVISCGVKVIILDPVSDLFDSAPLEEQAGFMKWQKSMVKNYNVTFINIAHIRKGSNNKESASTGAFVPEEAIIGASQQVKSASWVVMLARDKYNEDETIRNTTKIVLSKNRSNGVTGDAGSIYYCNKTHRLYNLDDYLNGNI